jgi:DNA-binding NarL/FixJ family response regulator
VRQDAYVSEMGLFGTLTEKISAHSLTSEIIDIDSQTDGGFEIAGAQIRLTKIEQTGGLLREVDSVHSRPQNGKEIVVIESRHFLRECLRRSIHTALSAPVETLSSVADWEARCSSELPRLIIISLADSSSHESLNAFGLLSKLAPLVPIVVLTSKFDFKTMRAVIGSGAKAYIPMSVGFEIAIEAVRFVMAGGTYVPPECLLSAIPAVVPPSLHSVTAPITSRELAVIRAIQQGKSNKVIAYDLNMSESTVKVRVRNVMKKMQARNRTDLAMKAGELGGL